MLYAAKAPQRTANAIECCDAAVPDRRSVELQIHVDIGNDGRRRPPRGVARDDSLTQADPMASAPRGEK